MLLLDFTISPLGKGESVGRYVAEAVDIVDKSGLPYRLHSMGTTVEGDWDECFALVKKCFLRMRRHAKRISISIKIDWREGKKGRLEGKVASIARRLGRAPRTR